MEEKSRLNTIEEAIEEIRKGNFIIVVDDEDRAVSYTHLDVYKRQEMEWEIDHIEMAVPLSPEELRQKRNTILKHQSQMESAPFLGDDERLFWQRSEERNRATADLYLSLIHI